jgi:Co/Zn/Cd efflux system component
VIETIAGAVEADGRFRVVDLHVWSIGPGYRAAIVSVQTDQAREAAEVESLIPDDLGIAHVTVEVRPG